MKRKNILSSTCGILCLVLTSCDFLNVVPDNIPTVEHAFANEMEARKYLATLYSYLPHNDDINRNIALFGSDEVTSWHVVTGDGQVAPMKLVNGDQNRNNPILDFWSGGNEGQNYYNALRDCNIFLENVSDLTKVVDIAPTERERWLGEAYFLKAYYTFFMMRMYGPVVLVRENLPIDAGIVEVRQKRNSFDECVEYVCGLLDEAAKRLPDRIINEGTELGRVTAPAALFLKAKVLVTAASPLFNGNQDYINFKNKDGEVLVNTEFSPEKWAKAAEACSLAVAACHAQDMVLYEFKEDADISEVTRRKVSVNNAATLRWNSESVWSLSSRNSESLQAYSMARLDNNDLSNISGGRDLVNPTIEISEKYYTANGVPMDEDKTYNYSRRYELRTSGADEQKYDLIREYTSIESNYGREPRFYAHLGFDGSVWWLKSAKNGSDEDTYTVQARAGMPQGPLGTYYYSVTGLWCKKLVNYKYELLKGQGFRAERYPWPEMRLTDLYLLYAEALNEAEDSPAARDEAMEWLDKVRKRAGLEGVKESWAKHSLKSDKFKSQAGLREIIHRERTIELMFEGSRFWDIRRWKEAEKELNNKTVSGWETSQESPEGFYNKQTLLTQKFVSPRDYLWPIEEYDLIVNPNLVQNPGW